MSITLGQAIKNAVEVERAGARFYQMLADKATDERARTFFQKLADDEVCHAEDLERQGRELGDQFDNVLSEACTRQVEQAPGWEHVEEITADQAFEIALEAENSAFLYYDSIADFATGEVKAFLERLAKVEEGHAATLRQRRDEFF